MMNIMYIKEGRHSIYIPANTTSYIELRSRDFAGIIDLGSNSLNTIKEIKKNDKYPSSRFIFHNNVVRYFYDHDFSSSLVYVNNNTRLDYIMDVTSSNISKIECFGIDEDVYIMPDYNLMRQKVRHIILKIVPT